LSLLSQLPSHYASVCNDLHLTKIIAEKLSDPDQKIKEAALSAMSRMKPSDEENRASMISGLLPFLQDPDSRLREQSFSALLDCCSNSIQVQNAIQVAGDKVFDSASAYGFLNSTNPNMQRVLEGILLSILNHKDDAMRLAAVNGFTGKIRTSEIQKAVEKMLYDKNNDVKKAAIEALHLASEGIIALMSTADAEGKEMLFSALRDSMKYNDHLSEKEILLLCDELKDKNAKIQNNAAEIVCQWLERLHNKGFTGIGGQVVARLAEALENVNIEMRRKITGTLVKLNLSRNFPDEAKEKILGQMNDDDPQVRKDILYIVSLAHIFKIDF